MSSSAASDERFTLDQRQLAGSAWLIGLGAAVVVEFVLLAVWQRNGFWETSDGVYLLSSREFLHGLVPYRDFAAAQPPPVYLVGAALLWIDDGLASVRAGLAVLDLVTAALVGIAVWRLSRRRELTVIAVLIAPLLPIALHEHSQLIPETLAAPLILGAALLSTNRDRTDVCAAGLALACLCKVAFVVPALAIIAVSPRRWRCLAVFVFAVAVFVGASLLAFGTAAWHGAVTAQFQVGRNPVHQVAGQLLQGIWNELPLVLLAGAALVFALRRSTLVQEPDLVLPITAAAVGGLVLVLTVYKQGSYIDVLAVAEPPLLALAVCGAGWLWQQQPPSRLLVIVAAAWLAAQSISLLTSPGDPWAAKRPGAASGFRWFEGPATVDQQVTAARACPRDRPYSGASYIAFLADRRMPGNQPDTFITNSAPINAAFAQRAAADLPRCPPS